MVSLVFAAPICVGQHYIIPADNTPWNLQNYRQVIHPKNGRSAGMTPQRDRAPFKTIRGSMTATSATAETLARSFGVYLVGFDLPWPALYAGVAGDGSDRAGRPCTPEGIGTRLAKHRVKATASNVGSGNGNGGVNHTRGWRSFAVARHRHFGGRGDEGNDMRLAVGTLSAAQSPTSLLAYFEHQIEADTAGVRTAVCRLLWPCVPPACVTTLTTATSSGCRPDGPIIKLWDGSIFDV